jgi:hypothetical protein
VPTYSSNQITNSSIRGNLIGISATLAIYSVFVGIAGLMMRRLQARLFVLLADVIMGLFLPTVIALNVVMELRNIPVWPGAIPFWIGMPAALWVVATLFRHDVRRAFDVASEQRRLDGASNLARQTPTFASETRLSRCALAGAIWAALGIIGLISAASLVLIQFQNRPSDEMSAPPAGLKMLALVIVTFAVATGVTSIFGTTICGAVAIGHIKHSSGRLYGLRLAAVDAIFFPLLAVFAAVAGTLGFGLTVLFPHVYQPPDYTGPEKFGLTGQQGVVLGAFVALPVCFFVGRAMWRAIVGHDRMRGTSLNDDSEIQNQPGEGRLPSEAIK